MDKKTSRSTIFIQRIIIILSLIITLEFLDQTAFPMQFSLTQSLNLNMTREHLISLGFYFTSFGLLTPLALLVVKKKTQTPQ